MSSLRPTPSESANPLGSSVLQPKVAASFARNVVDAWCQRDRGIPAYGPVRPPASIGVQHDPMTSVARTIECDPLGVRHRARKDAGENRQVLLRTDEMLWL